MSNFLEELGIEEDVFESQSAADVASLVKPGVHKAIIESCFAYNTDSGARMVSTTYKVESTGQTITYMFPLKSGDEKGNKTLEFGVKQLKNLMEAVSVTDLKLVEGERKIGDINRKIKFFKNLAGKKVIIGVRIEESEQYGDKNIIELVLNVSGENAKGENLEEKLAKKIEKNPIKKSKKTSSTNTVKAATKQEQPTSWD